MTHSFENGGHEGNALVGEPDSGRRGRRIVRSAEAKRPTTAKGVASAGSHEASRTSHAVDDPRCGTSSHHAPITLPSRSNGDRLPHPSGTMTRVPAKLVCVVSGCAEREEMFERSACELVRCFGAQRDRDES